MEQRNWQPLETRLADGASIEEAAKACNVTIDEAIEWLNTKKKLEEFEDAAATFCARDVLQIAVSELKNLAMICPDPIVRRQAAASLLTLWRDERRRLERRAAKRETNDVPEKQKDLFGEWRDLKRAKGY